MSRYFKVITNCSKKNKLALKHIPLGEIIDNDYFRHDKDEKEHWNDTRICLIKVKDFKEQFDLYKWLKTQCTRLSWEPRTTLNIPEHPSPVYVRPICFQAITHEYLAKKMVRTYQLLNKDCCITEGSHRILDDEDVASVLDGDIDLLNLGREITLEMREN